MHKFRIPHNTHKKTPWFRVKHNWNYESPILPQEIVHSHWECIEIRIIKVTRHTNSRQKPIILSVNRVILFNTIQLMKRPQLRSQRALKMLANFLEEDLLRPLNTQLCLKCIVFFTVDYESIFLSIYNEFQLFF